MKRIKIIPNIVMIALLILISCSKEWLKPDPLSFFAPENIYTNEEGFESGLVRCRKEMSAENHGYANYIATQTAWSDLAIALRQTDFSKNTPSGADVYPIISDFAAVYGYIKDANVIISRIDDIEWTDQNVRNRILSEAYWFRAYWYYHLVNTYGDVPWVGKEYKEAKLDFYSTSRWAILTKLQKDLEFAVANLPDTPAKLGNITKGAANHLLAKVYLANCEFDKAIAAATAVINSPYALMTTRFGIDIGKGWHDYMWDLHRCQNKNLAVNTETIYATVDRATAPPATWWPTAGTNSMANYEPEYWRIPDTKGVRACNWNTRSGDTLGKGNFPVRTTFFFNYWIWGNAKYQNTTTDLRRAPNNWIEMDDTLAEFTCVVPTSPNYGQRVSKYWGVIDTLQNWYPWPSYKTYNPTPNTATAVGGEGDWYIFRLAETYLLRAEAYYWKGLTSLAADDINKVRDRAKASLITASDVTIDYIFDERARELYMEEARQAEMARVSCIMAKLNLNGYSLSTISQKNWYYDRVMRLNYFYHLDILFLGNHAFLEPHNIFWPIPQKTITANTLGRINQNIGYEGDNLNVPPFEEIP